jgi:ectoine hydroxylase-related dioxygenase (phytanoyl-CoA dioxygenase family)
VWVALEPSTIENGCLRVIPGSHRDKALHEHLHEDRNDLTLNQRMADGTFDESQAVDLQLQPGEMSMHDVYMIHGAKANTSAHRRTGVALRFIVFTRHQTGGWQNRCAREFCHAAFVVAKRPRPHWAK